MDEVQIPSYSIFIRYGYVQHEGDGYGGTHALRYHMYIIPADNNLKDAISYPYGRSFRKWDDLDGINSHPSVASSSPSRRGRSPTPSSHHSNNENSDNEQGLQGWEIGAAGYPPLG